MLYSKKKGIALVSIIDKSLYYLEDILYVSKLSINLISIKKLYKSGYKGTFNNKIIKITNKSRIVITTK